MIIAIFLPLVFIPTTMQCILEKSLRRDEKNDGRKTPNPQAEAWLDYVDDYLLSDILDCQ